MSLLHRAGSRTISPKVVLIHIAAGLLALNAAADTAFITVPLQRNAAADPDATGKVTLNLAKTSSSMLVQTKNLAPGRTYVVTTGGEARGTFVADGTGRGRVQFAQPPTTGALPFNFDPRGKQLVIQQSGRPVLLARISGPGEPIGSTVNEEVGVPRVPGVTAGRAQARYELSAAGARRFSVTLTNVADGNWILYVDGIRRGTIAASGGVGAIAFDNDAATPEPALNFDPRPLWIDLVRGAVLQFSGRFAARANGINVATPSIQTRYIFNAGTAPSGLARVERWTDRDARRGLDVEVINVPADIYELYVNAVFKGFFPVAAGIGGVTFGEMKFVSEPEDEDEQMLNFNPFASSYVIQILGTVYFAGEPIAIDLGDTDVATNVPVRMALPLFNLGIDSDGVARTIYKRDDRGSRHFEVVLRNVPTGQYSLTLGGLLIGVIQVDAAGAGTRGTIEFEDEPEAGENQLSFDPLGRVVGIERAGDGYFERTFPVNP